MRALGWLLMLLCPAACSVSRPEVKEYLVDPVVTAQQADDVDPTLPSVRIQSFGVRPFLDQQGIAYRQGAVRAGAYHFHRWAEPLHDTVLRELVERLRESRRFGAVLAPLDPGAAHWELDVELLGFHEWADESGGDVHAVVELALVLSRAGRPSDLPSRVRLLQESPVAGAGLDDLVQALDQALAQTLAEASGWLAETVARSDGSRGGH